MRKRATSAVVVVIACILGLAWWLGWFGEDPALAEVKAIQQTLENPNLSDTEVRATMSQLRTKMESLSSSSRRAAWVHGRAVFERRELSRMQRILAMHPQQRVKALDEEINRMEQRRVQWQQRAGQAQNARSPGGQRSGERTRSAFQSDEQRVSRLKKRLDRSTPQQRAMRAEYTRLINERRAQRGLQPIQRGRG